MGLYEVKLNKCGVSVNSKKRGVCKQQSPTLK